MNKKVLSLLLLPLLLSACSGSGNTDSSSGSGEEGEIIDIDVNEYDDWANTWSKPGHLYFHYNRGEKKGYENYCLWLWQHDPSDLEGALWGFSADPKVSEKLTLKPMSTSFMTYEDVGKGSEGSGTFIDNFGVIFDVDLYRSDLVGGKTGSSTSYEGMKELGFLLPQQDSMSGVTNWVSDGGRETYLEDIDASDKWRSVGDGKAIHVFVSTGALDEPAYFADAAHTEAKTNPINDDMTGQYSSAVDSYPKNDLGVTSTSEKFKEDGVGYQIFVASFRDGDGDGKGDLRGIINALDEGFFDDLNVDVLWLTPIQKSDSYHGYDISDYYSVDKKFGTIDDYAELLYKCHHTDYSAKRERKIKVLMDLVLNHTSKSNKWFINSQWGVEEDGFKWRDVYTWKFENEIIDKYIDGEYKKVTVKEDAESKNPSWYRDGESHYYYYGKFGSGMPEINYLSANTRKLVINMARYWMSFGLDGFRLDAVKHIFMRDECYNPNANEVIITDVGSKRAYDDEKGEYVTKDFDYSSNLTRNVDWWKEFAHGVKSAYPNCFLVGENFDGWGTRTSPYYQALDSQFDFGLYYHIASEMYSSVDTDPIGVFKSSHPKETYDKFGSTEFLDSDIGHVQAGCRGDYIDGGFTSNHDVMRAINHVNYTSQVSEMGPHYRDTTDNPSISGSDQQIGRAKIHGAVTMLGQGISWIYYGDELGMTSNTDEHIAMYGSENSIDVWYRQPYLWNDKAIRPAYKAGQYCFGDIHGEKSQIATKDPYGYDSYNLSLPTYETQKATAGSMYKWYQGLTAIKDLYPSDHKVAFHNSSYGSTLVLVVSGSGNSMVIYINIGGHAEYKMNPGEIIKGDFENVYALGTDVPTTIGGDIGNCPYGISVWRRK